MLKGQNALYPQIIKALSKSRRATFLSGPAGSGKSTLIAELSSSKALGSTVVLSSTGISAQSIGGRTIHSAFRLSPGPVPPKAKITAMPCRTLQDAETIIIDEVSMMRSDHIDRCNFLLKKLRKNKKPFGGARLVFLGDFYQLPPVVTPPIRKFLLTENYESPYAYSAHLFERRKPAHYELTRVHRQNDPEFIDYLAKLRLGKNTSSVIDYFNDTFLNQEISGQPVVIAANNKRASEYNQMSLSNQLGEPKSFHAIQRGDMPSDSIRFNKKLVLKVGAKVMATQNVSNSGYQNGSTGTVVGMHTDSIHVQFDHLTKPVAVKRYKWTAASKNNGQNSFTQFPLMLAYALTVHKAQGLTLKKLIVDPTGRFFAEGQAYVALSRVTDPSGLSLSSPLQQSDILFENVHSYRLDKMKKLKLH